MQLYGQERLRKRNNYTSADDLKIMDCRFACIEFFLYTRALTLTHTRTLKHMHMHAYIIDTHQSVFVYKYFIIFDLNVPTRIHIIL